METWIDQYAKIDYAREKGLEEGMEKGMEKGMEMGAAQRNAEIARAMLAEGLDAAVIAKCTGLTAEEVDVLKKSLSAEC